MTLFVLRLPDLHCTPLTEAELSGEFRSSGSLIIRMNGYTVSCVHTPLNVTESFLQIQIEDEVCQVCRKAPERKRKRECLVRPHYALNMCISILHPCCVGLIIKKNNKNKGHTTANLPSLVFNQAHFRLDTF